MVGVDRGGDFGGAPVVVGPHEEIEVGEWSLPLGVIPAGSRGRAFKRGQLNADRFGAMDDLGHDVPDVTFADPHLEVLLHQSGAGVGVQGEFTGANLAPGEAGHAVFDRGMQELV